MSNLIERLHTALNEAEQTARAATPGPWHALDGGVTNLDDQWPVAATDSKRDREDRAFIAANNPAHALRTIDAHREILDAHPPEEDIGWDPGPDWCATCRYDGGRDRHLFPCPTVQAIAAIYLPNQAKLSRGDSTGNAPNLSQTDSTP